MDIILYIENAKKEARKHNLDQVRNEINKTWVQEKINNYIQRWDYIFSKEEIINQIMTNDIVASQFAKDPSKQNISEKIIISLLKVNKLPASGKNCIRFDTLGNITDKNIKDNTKSADFIYNNYYATQKYTDQVGGAQDNQRDDVISFLTKGSIQHKVCAVLDGNYWNNQEREKLKYMFKDNSNVLITSAQEILDRREHE